MASREVGVYTDLAEQEIELKSEKSMANSNFTLYRNRLLLIIDEQHVQRRELNNVCIEMDSHMKSSMEVMSKLTDIYIKNKELENGRAIVNEMEKLAEEFHSAYESVWNVFHGYKTETDKSNTPSYNLSQSSVEASGLFRSTSTWTEQTVNQKGKHEPECSDSRYIGEDLWMQLKRIQIPTFSGDKKNYRNWKAAFMACVDTAPATGEYKLLQLRQCLSGEALHVIENLGHSASAYEAAKERLERRYGGKRRQVAIYLAELEQFPQVRSGNAHDLEQFADLLEFAILNLKETGHHNELGNGFLYAKLQTKLTESMLAKYHCWIFETQIKESVVALKTWVFQE